MACFTEVDVNKDKFIKKIDLRKKIETIDGADKLTDLVATIKARKEMLVDRREFEKIVDAWVAAK